jgi:membrane associated rhomboid family serine protease
LQFFFGTYTSLQSETPGGVAWWAHVGGFVVGIILLHLFAPRTVRLPFRPPNR